MPNFKNNNRRNGNNKRSNYKEYTDQMKGLGEPYGDKSLSDKSLTISKFAMRDLPKSTYSFKSDPYASQVPSSREYEILTQFNRVFGPTYGGDHNIDGGTITSYSTSQASKFLSCPDVMTLPINLNYRYLPMKGVEDYGSQITRHMYNSVEDAYSLLEATTYTSLEFKNYAVITTMPLPWLGDNSYEEVYEIKNGQKVATGVSVLTDPAAVMFTTAVIYQIMMQELAHVVDTHSSWRTSQGEMMRMSYDRDTAALNELFSIMNKSSFLNKMDSVSMNFDGEFFDVNWRIQANTLANVKSRRSQGVLDPLIEIESNYNVPEKFELLIPVRDSEGDIVSLTTIFNLHAEKYRTRIYPEPDSFTKLMSFPQLAAEWTSMNSVSNTLRLVRDGTLDTSHYFNVCSNLITAFGSVFDDIKKAFSDFKTALKTLLRPGVVTWVTNFRPALIKDTDNTMVNYLIVNHILNEAFSGAAEITFNESTSRYQSFVLWNMHYGIPAFSLYQGGAFISFSAKGPDSIQFSELRDYLPVGFTLGDMVDIETGNNVGQGLRLVNRLGQLAYITRREVTGSSDPDILRLFPVPQQANLKMYIPVCPLASQPDNEDFGKYNTSTNVVYANHIERVMMNIFGLCEVWYPESTIAGSTVEAHKSVSVSPDIVSVYQYEISDVSAQMQTYAKANGPFRGVPYDDSKVGFLSLTSGKNIQ